MMMRKIASFSEMAIDRGHIIVVARMQCSAHADEFDFSTCAQKARHGYAAFASHGFMRDDMTTPSRAPIYLLLHFERAFI